MAATSVENKNSASLNAPLLPKELVKADSDVNDTAIVPMLEVPERAVYMVFLTVFIDILAATISTPVMPFYAKLFGANTMQIGYLFAAWSFCSTVFAPLLGSAADRIGRRPILIFALIGAGMSNILQGFSVYAIYGLRLNFNANSIRNVFISDSNGGLESESGSASLPDSVIEEHHKHNLIQESESSDSISITNLNEISLNSDANNSTLLLLPSLGPSLAFYIFALFRASSGVFAAIGTVTNVYMADVIPKSLLPTYMAKMSVVGPLAFTFGPSMGGGLAAIGGYNVPVFVDGVLTLFSAFLVSLHLPETPAFLRGSEEKERKRINSESENHNEDSGGPTQTDSDTVEIPRGVYILSLASFFGGLSFSSSVSMQALFLSEVYNLDVLHVTYVSVGSAVVMVLTGMFISDKIRKLLGLTTTVSTSYILSGFFYFFMCYCGFERKSIFCWLLAVWTNGMLSGIARASGMPLLMEFTEAKNRGKITSTNQFFMNCGRLVGPLVYGYMATVYDISIVWGIAGVCSIINGCLAYTVRPPSSEDVSISKVSESGPKSEAAEKLGEGGIESESDKKRAFRFQRSQTMTSYGVGWEDEYGSISQIEELGKFVANLLSTRHYRWVSRKKEVEALLDKLLPEIDVETKERYEARFNAIELAANQMSTPQTVV